MHKSSCAIKGEYTRFFWMSCGSLSKAWPWTFSSERAKEECSFARINERLSWLNGIQDVFPFQDYHEKVDQKDASHEVDSIRMYSTERRSSQKMSLCGSNQGTKASSFLALFPCLSSLLLSSDRVVVSWRRLPDLSQSISISSLLTVSPGKDLVITIANRGCLLTATEIQSRRWELKRILIHTEIGHCQEFWRDRDGAK